MFPYLNRFSAPSCVFCPSSIEFVSVCLLRLCVFSKISSIGRASPCCLPFPLLFPHFSSLYIFTYFNFSEGHCQCSYICTDFLLLCFCPVSFEYVSFTFSKISSRWRKSGYKVEKRWRASPSCLTFPPPDTFPHPRGFPTPANSGKTKDFWEIFFFDRVTLCLSTICALKYPSI